MNDFEFARALHVVAVMMWIGGVAFVTTVVFRAVRRDNKPNERLSAFEAIERGFAPQARLWVLLAGSTGLWMVGRGNLWPMLFDARSWWLGAMVILWLIFAIMLFVLEPLVLHRRMKSSPAPGTDFDRMERLHRLLLFFAVVVVLGAVAGVHGLI